MKRVKILRASAGSGKTYRLAYEYIRSVITQPHAFGSILAVTFTNKATEEMKSRIIAELNTLSVGHSPYMDDLLLATGLPKDKIVANARLARSLILHDYSRFAVSTIDKFFQKIVRGFVKELGLDFGYTVELHSDNYLGEAVDRIIESTANDKQLETLVNRVLNDNIDNAKSWDVRADLIKIGKQVLAERYVVNHKGFDSVILSYNSIKNIVEQKREALSKECEVILDIMSDNGLVPSDFKGGSKSFAFYFLKLAEGTIIERMDRLEKASQNANEWFSKTSPRKNDISSISQQLMRVTCSIIARYEEYEYIKNSYELVSANFNRSLLLGYIACELEKLWAERGRLPLSQANKLIGALVENTSVPFIYEKAGTWFDIYMIDEFQDTSLGQWNNFLPLLEDAVARCESQNVMLIGDVKQAIYRWRAGDWGILHSQAPRHWGEDADTQEQLNTNWRSLPVVVDFNNALIRSVVAHAADKTLSSVYADFEQSIPKAKQGGYVAVNQIEDEDLEKYLIQQVQNALDRGYRLGDMAMLVRNKKHGRMIADVLLSNGFSIIDHESLLLVNSIAVRMIVALLKLAVNKQDKVSLAQFNLWCAREPDAVFEDVDLLEQITLLTPLEAIDRIITHFRLGDTPENVTYVQAFYQSVMNFTRDNTADTAAFVEWWDEHGCKLSLYLPSSQDAVTIVTIHKSKGLQYPIVFIPFCKWELEPTHYNPQMLWACTDDELFAPFNPAPVVYCKVMERSVYAADYAAEKRSALIDAVNMLYVAVTRAERELYIMYGTKLSQNDIGMLVNEAIGEQRTFGRKDFYDSCKKENREQNIIFDSFDIANSQQKIKTNWQTQRYFEDGGKIETPINKGVLMHRIFSQITTVDDVQSVLGAMVISGDITDERVVEIGAIVEQALSNSVVASWFDGKWRVYSENDIIIPSTKATKRPDRVITNGAHAIVVDYKFGSVHKASYVQQIEQYAELLLAMGYKSVEGYIWYVETAEVVRVDL